MSEPKPMSGATIRLNREMPLYQVIEFARNIRGNIQQHNGLLYLYTEKGAYIRIMCYDPNVKSK